MTLDRKSLKQQQYPPTSQKSGRRKRQAQAADTPFV
jgi:hypothetical protein